MEQKTCECGFIVRGNTIKHAEANLKIHQKSKQHKKQIQLIIKEAKEQ